MKTCFTFVCQRGELEIKALLLAASLRRYSSADSDLVAAVPKPGGRSELSPPVVAALGALGVRLVEIYNPIGTDYPIGNKLACLGVTTDADKVVFLDSDMLCLRPFFTAEHLDKSEAHAKPADVAGVGSDLARWQAIYALSGLPMPTRRVHATVTGESMPPYFNAGFVAMTRGSRLADQWIACAREIDAAPQIDAKRPWLDQLALPVAMARAGIEPGLLDERFNHPAHIRPLANDDPPYLCHYHWPHVIGREPKLRSAVEEYARAIPALHDLMSAQPEWARLITKRVVAVPADAPPARELLVTGIPRSGTSYACKVLHSVPDCVIVNEPSEIFASLSHESLPLGVATFHRDLRRDVLDGVPIRNKLRDGEFIEDTAVIDQVEWYSPHVSRHDFVIGSKNTLAYLARLPQLRTAMPQARVLGMVRHPMDTIASWKTTFAHLAAADLESQMLGHSRDSLLTELARERLREVAGCPDESRRRALLWKHLALLLLEAPEGVVILRYEEAVSDPGAVLHAALHGWLPPSGQANVLASQARSRSSALDDADRAAIVETCATVAARLGYFIS